MSFDGRRIFVLGGELSPGAQVDEAKLMYVLNTSIHFLFVLSFGLPASLKHRALRLPETQLQHSQAE